MEARTSTDNMSTPPARVQQSSIRSFFQPRTTTPNYAPPPVVSTAASTAPPVQSPTQTSSLPHNESKTPIHNQATISPVDPLHIQPLRRINSLLLPVNYPDSFYTSILSSTKTSFSRTILWSDNASKTPKVIGGIICRLDPSLAPDSTAASPKYTEEVYDIYVQSLVLLSPYRRLGLATAALQSVIETATEQSDVRIVGLYAHVWTENEEGLEWYAARGFTKEGDAIRGYYKRLTPGSALIMRRRLNVGDHLAAPSSREGISSVTAPSKASPAQHRPGMSHTASFQDRRPDREWNDLPEDVLGSSLLKPPSGVSKDGSAASSRSSSRGAPKKKKERAYPAAAFGP